ncbi:DUF3500 domain-containing protein [Microterricola viridarii]|uniref:DUF3500 domain-containing protein n=1 Tax=Microterricola viridarii TaxID=412690 RepID=A0A1H1PHM8_9MICO|nr:DUF3500 domain-containing protein [Microterricola viridarii]SDS10752.1 Protein of unknown function [Microterricola viridarii]
MADDDFRAHLFPVDDPRISAFRGLSYREYAEAVKSDPFAGPMIVDWATRYPVPYRGVSHDGNITSQPLAELRAGEAAPNAAMVAAAELLLAGLSARQRADIGYPLRASQWRSWANPEFLQHDTGLRLEDLDQVSRHRALELVRASLSEQGFESVKTLMWVNGYLGETIDLANVMNDASYNVAIYGTPSTSEPWGWQLFGHHLALNCVVDGERMTVSPAFLGAEPSLILESPIGPVDVFGARIAHARALMAGLTPAEQAEVLSYPEMVDPAMPLGRLHPGDERHLGGCFQDNRIVPFEGILVGDLDEPTRAEVSAVAAAFLDHLPAGVAAARLREIESRYDETWFSWIGGWGAEDAFYFRIQSPVVMLELDHHCGVFLSNRTPAQFHVHTGIRTPNGGDYGGLLRAPEAGAS